MPSFSSKKAQFFILTAVVIVGVFFTLSKYITPYAFIDTSEAVDTGEIFLFNNVKEKTIKAIEISNSTNATELDENLQEYKKLVQEVAAEKGFNLVFDYRIEIETVNVTMTLTSEKNVFKSVFAVLRD